MKISSKDVPDDVMVKMELELPMKDVKMLNKMIHTLQRHEGKLQLKSVESGDNANKLKYLDRKGFEIVAVVIKSAD